MGGVYIMWEEPLLLTTRVVWLEAAWSHILLFYYVALPFFSFFFFNTHKIKIKNKIVFKES